MSGNGRKLPMICQQNRAPFNIVLIIMNCYLGRTSNATVKRKAIKRNKCMKVSLTEFLLINVIRVVDCIRSQEPNEVHAIFIFCEFFFSLSQLQKI